MNRCKCQDPPGGETVCEENQIALCIVENGVAQNICLNPVDSSIPKVVLNSVLSGILDQQRNRNKKISESEIMLLSRGIFKQEDKTISFGLNDSVKSALISHVKRADDNDDLVLE